MRQYVIDESIISGVMVFICLLNVLTWNHSVDSVYTCLEKLALAAAIVPCLIACGYSILASSWLLEPECKAIDLPLWRMALTNVVITFVGGGLPFLAFFVFWGTLKCGHRMHKEDDKKKRG